MAKVQTLQSSSWTSGAAAGSMCVSVCVRTLLIELVLIHLEAGAAAAARAEALAGLAKRRPDGALLRVLDAGQIAAARHAHRGRQVRRVRGQLVEDQAVAVAARRGFRQQP